MFTTVFNGTIWLLLTAVVVELAGCLGRAGRGYSRPALARILGSRLICIALCITALAGIVSRIYVGYAVPGDIGQDVVSAESWLRGGSLYPTDLQARLARWLETDPPIAPLADRIPIIRRYQSEQLQAIPSLYVVQAHTPPTALISTLLVRLVGPNQIYLIVAGLSLVTIYSTVQVLGAAFPALFGSRHKLAVHAAVFGWQPILATLRQGQFTILITGLLVWAWRNLREGRPARAGVAIGVATILKLYPGILIPYLFLRHKRAFWFAISTCAIGTAGVIAFAGWGTVPEFLRATNVVEAQYGLAMNNFSPPARLSLLLGTTRPWLWTIGFAISLSLALVTTWCVRQLGRRRSPKRSINMLDLEYSIFTSLGCVLSPICWSHYFVALLLPLAVLLGEVRLTRCGILMVSCIALLLSLPDQVSIWLAHHPLGAVGLLLSSFPTVALLALLIWLVWSRTVLSSDAKS